MIETVAIWLAGKTVGALVEPVLTKLAGDIANDLAKDKSKGFVNKLLGRAAVQELARGWKDDPAVQEFLASLSDETGEGFYEDDEEEALADSPEEVRD